MVEKLVEEQVKQYILKVKFVKFAYDVKEQMHQNVLLVVMVLTLFCQEEPRLFTEEEMLNV